MDEVAAIPVAAEPLFGKSMAPLGLVGPIGLHIDSQLLRPMSELALISVGAEAFFSEVLAKRALGFASEFGSGVNEASISGVQGLIRFSGGFRACI